MNDFQRMLGCVRRAVETYHMIEDGDTVAVGVSGGKDSVMLLRILSALREFLPQKFDICGITIDMGFDGMDFGPTTELCRSLGIPYHTVKTEISDIIFNIRKEKNPCSLCAKMRRGALHDAAKAHGCNKVALGHHKDDVIDTFMLNLIYGGRLGTFQPVTYLSRKDITMIRPLIYVREYEVRNLVEKEGLPVVTSTCPADKHTEREEMKKLLTSLDREYRGIRERIFGAIERAELDGWHE